MSEKYFSEHETMNSSSENAKKSGVNIGLIIFIVGFVTAVIGGFFCYNTDLHKYHKTADFNNTFSASDVKNINIDGSVGNFTIVKTTDKEISVIAKNVPEKYTAEVKNDTLSISTSNPKSFWLQVPFLTYTTPKVEIYLPEKEYEKLFLKSGGGDVEISDLTFKDATFESGAGDKNIHDFTCDKIALKSGAGDSELNNIKCKSMTVNKGAGDMNADGINCDGILTLKTGAGDSTMINTVTGGFNLVTGAGDLRFAGTINGDIDIDSGAGDLTIELTNPESDFGKNGKYSMKIDKGAGDKEITYNN